MKENMEVRVEVEDDHVVLVFPRKVDDLMMPWQDARNIGTILERAANDVPNRSLIINPVEVQRESNQVKLNTHKGFVVLLVDHTDRIKLNPYAAVVVARAILKMAQDAEYETVKGVKFVYNKHGMLKAIHNKRLNGSQIIPGR